MSTPVLRSVAATGQDALVECRLLRAGDPFIGKQGLQYQVGISAESVGAKGIHLQLVTIPPGGRAKAHKHATHEKRSMHFRVSLACGTASAWRTTRS